MSVYFGETGLVEIQRTAVGSGYIAANLAVGDVVEAKRRFSLDIPASTLITGDRIEIGTQDLSPLELVAGHIEPDGYWYCHVDPAGGIRLYDTFSDSIGGTLDTALELVTPTKDQQIYIRNRDLGYNCIAQTRSWSFTTTRDAVDITTLGTYFRDLYSDGTIAGQGSMVCIWDYRIDPCDQDVGEDDELAHYFAQLLLRVQQGSLFKGRFFVHAPDQGGKAVWYEADCIITNIGFNFAPGAVIESTIEFVTTGQVQLLVDFPPQYLLQEDDDFILTEDGGRIELEDPD